MKGTLLNPTYGSLERDRIERVYIPKDPPNPNSYLHPKALAVSNSFGNGLTIKHVDFDQEEIVVCRFRA